MPEMLSPGVFVTEIDASTIVPSVSNSIAVFAGDFMQGPVEKYTLITTVDELISFYGKPTNTNYNDWYQVYNFLQYGNKIYVARAANTNGSRTVINGETFTLPDFESNVFTATDMANFAVGDVLSFSNLGDSNVYIVESVVAGDVTLDRVISLDETVDGKIYKVEIAFNSIAEGMSSEASTPNAVTVSSEFLANYIGINNQEDWENNEMNVGFTNIESKLKFISRNPGAWGNDIEIAILKSSDFTATGANTVYAFPGISAIDLYEYFPTGTEVGVVVRYKDEIKEIFTVSFDETSKDNNGKSMYVESVINNQSNYVFVKDNTAITDVLSYSYVWVPATDTVDAHWEGGSLNMQFGADSSIQSDDLITAYELWNNKEDVDIDIIISNELYPKTAVNLATTRKDCIAFIGATREDTVGHKASDVVDKLVYSRVTEGSYLFENNMFAVACGNYKYQYDRYNDKNRWINIAGDIAGLRAYTSTTRASWWASAGLERGQVKNVKKLAFNPNQGHRDILYKNAINPIVSFPGQGTVMWGQKTLLDKPSSFDRVNVRGLFNTLERSLAKMAKYQVMEFNDNFTRNRIISMIKPFLSSVQAGRGIQDYLVICDTSNNTPDVISRNQLVVDVYIKPTYVAEFIHLKFTNAGTKNFSEVIGG